MTSQQLAVCHQAVRWHAPQPRSWHMPRNGPEMAKVWAHVLRMMLCCQWLHDCLRQHDVMQCGGTYMALTNGSRGFDVHSLAVASATHASSTCIATHGIDGVVHMSCALSSYQVPLAWAGCSGAVLPIPTGLPCWQANVRLSASNPHHADTIFACGMLLWGRQHGFAK
jgi:hypothetical protein